MTSEAASDGAIVARVNDDLLYQGPDGREAWLCFTEGRVTIVTDIHNMGAPYNAVVFRPAILRRIADMIEERQADKR